MNHFDTENFDEEFETQQIKDYFKHSNERPKFNALEMMSPILPLSPIPPFSTQREMSNVQTSQILVWDSPQESSSVTNALSNRNTFSLRKFAQHQSHQQPSTSSAAANRHTPKSSRKVYNPFESMTIESLTSDMCSPGIFQKKKSGKRCFQWTIDEKAVLCPANFLETEIPSPSAQEFFSPGFEKRAQSALNHYWQNVHYLPSPEITQKKKSKHFVNDLTTFSREKKNEIDNAENHNDEKENEMGD